MSTLLNTDNLLIPSNVIELSTYGFCSWLDHHIFKDTSLSPTGYNFFYPLTAYGGPLSAVPGTTIPNVFVSGGPLYEICYQDFCFKNYDLGFITIRCITTVNFILTALDESVSDIIKIMYNFGDGSDIVITSYEPSNPLAPSPKDIMVSHVYYPTEKTLTTYRAALSVLYNNCCINTYSTVLCSFRCGILEMYEDVNLLDATQTLDSYNIVMTLESNKRKQVFDTLLDLNEPLPYLSALPNVIEPVPQAERDTAYRSLTAQKTRRNPIRPPIPVFIYREGVGIDLTPDLPQLAIKEAFIAISTSGIILSGIGAPYRGGAGITISA